MLLCTTFFLISSRERRCAEILRERELGSSIEQLDTTVKRRGLWRKRGQKKKHWSYFFGIICVLVFFGGQKTCLAQDSAENFISLEFFGILSSLGVQEERKRRECKELAEVRERTKWRLLILLFDPSGNSQKTASGSSRNATNLIAEVINTRVDTPPARQERTFRGTSVEEH